MYYTIYQITCHNTGKIYIGKHETENLDDGYMGSGKLLTRAQKKYGLENFTKQILYIFESEDDMNAKEVELVTEEFCDREDTYNICPGGQGGWGYLNRNDLNKSENQKAAARESIRKLNSILTKEQRSQRSRNSGISRGLKIKNGLVDPPFKGKRHTEEWKLEHSVRMKIKSKGMGNSQYGTMWITNGEQNKKIRKDLDAIPEGWRKGRIMKYEII